MSVADGVVMAWVVALAAYWVPDGVTRFRWGFLAVLVGGGVVQNVLVTACPVLTPLRPNAC